MLMSFLSPSLRCNWNLSSSEEASISTSVFVGMLLGAPVWGYIDDICGRRKGYIYSVVGTLVCGLCSTFSTGLAMLLIFRGGVGFCVSGSHVAMTMLSEFLPKSYRAVGIMCVGMLWSVGAILEAFLAWIIMPNIEDPDMNWRVLLVVSSAPLLLLLFLSPYVPESPRWDVENGNMESAMRTLSKAAMINGTSLPPGKLVKSKKKGNDSDDHEKTSRTAWRLLRLSEFQRLLALWCCVCVVYYGVVLLSTGINSLENTGDRCPKFNGRGSNDTDTTSSACSGTLSTSDYRDAFVDSIAELPGLFVMIFFLDIYGRRRTIMVASLICSVFFFALLPCLNREFEQSALFLARMLIAGIFQCIFVYTPELFPTNIRATALGMCSSFARIGGMSTPIFAVVLLDANDSIALLCYALFCILSGVLMFSLPFETLGAPMGVAFKRLLGEKKSGGGYSDLERVDN
eukprot:g42.t1